MCPIHHDVIDADPTSYTVERLLEIKTDHESKFQFGLEPSDDVARALVQISDVKVEQGSVLIAVNQSGGQIAHSITNILSQSAKEPALQPVVTRVDDAGNPQLHTLQVRLKNAGDARPTDAVVRIAVPERFIRHNWQPGQKPLRGNRQEFECDNAFFLDQNLFQQLYPGQISKQVVLEVHYFVDPADETAVSEQVEIEVRSGDASAHLARITVGQLAQFEPQKLYSASAVNATETSQLSAEARAG